MQLLISNSGETLRKQIENKQYASLNQVTIEARPTWKSNVC